MASVGIRSTDATPPLSRLAPIGADYSAAADHVIAVPSGRVKIELAHAGSAGRVWIGVGQAAAPDIGPTWLDPGDEWSEFTDEQIHIFIDQTSSAQRIVGMEWGA